MTALQAFAAVYVVMGLFSAATTPIEHQDEAVMVVRFLFWPAVLGHLVYTLVTRR